MKVLLCNILPGLNCISNNVYEILAKNIFENEICVRLSHSLACVRTA